VSVVKQRLKCNTGKVCNCLIQFLPTVVLSIEERVFISAQRLSERTVYSGVLFVTEALRGVMPNVGPGLEPKFESEQRGTLILWKVSKSTNSKLDAKHIIAQEWLLSVWGRNGFFLPVPPDMSLMDFVVSLPGCGRSVTEFWGWDAHEAQLRYPDEVDGDIWIWSTRRGLKPKLY
jgi:hypothetical protein